MRAAAARAERFAGSTHPTGELIEWEPRGDGAPATVDGGDLCAASRGSPPTSPRCSPAWRAPATSPGFLSLELPPASSSLTPKSSSKRWRAPSATRDTKDFKAAVKSTYALAEAGKPYTGLPTLEECFGDKIADKVTRMAN